jgi:autotransporter translocation and assembly factor TamB
MSDVPATRSGGRRGPSRALLVVGALCLVALAAVALSGSDRVNDRLLRWLVTQVDAQIAGSFEVGRLEGSIVTGYSMREIEIQHDGEVVLAIDSIRFDFDWSQFALGRFGIEDLVVDTPTLIAKQGPEGRLDLIEALAFVDAEGRRLEPSAKEPTPFLFPIWVQDIQLQAGTFRIEPIEGAPITVLEIRLRADANAHGRVIAFDTPEFAFALEHHGAPRLLVEGAATAERRNLDQRVHINRLVVSTEHSRLVARGDIRPSETLDLIIDLERIAHVDLARFVPDIGKFPDAQGRLSASGSWSAIQLDGSIDWQTAQLAFSGHTDLQAPSALTSDLTLTLDVPELRDWLHEAQWAGHLMVDAKIAEGEAVASSSLTHRDGTLRSKGRMTRLFESELVPNFVVDVEAKRFDLSRVFPAHPEWASEIDGGVHVEGAGRDLETLEAAARLDVSRSRVGGIQIDRAVGRLEVDRDQLHFSNVVVDSTVGEVTLTGDISTRSDGPLDLEGRIALREIAPLLEMAELDGEGEIDGEFRVTGRIDEARWAGQLRSPAARVDVHHMNRAALAFDVVICRARDLSIVGKANLAIEDFTTSAFEGRLALELGHDSDSKQPIDLQLVAVDRDDREQRIDLSGTLRDRLFVGVLEKASFESDAGDWALAAATPFEISDDSLAVEHLRFERSDIPDAWIEANGRLARQGEQQFELQARSQPITLLTDRVERLRDAEIGGVFDMDLDVRGDASAPTALLDASTRSLSIRGESVEAARAKLRFASNELHLDLDLHQADDRHLKAEGSMPFDLSWSQEPAFGPAGEIDLHAFTDAFHLDFLEPLFQGEIEDLEGSAAIDLHLTGPIENPRPVGQIAIRDVAFRPKATKVPVEQMSAVMSFDLSTARLDSFTASAGDGTVSATGDARWAQSGLESLSSELILDAWPIISSTSYVLITSGRLRASGTASSPHLVGELAIDEGSLRPELEFLIEKPVAADPTIVFEERGETESDVTVGGGGESPEAPPFFDLLSLDVRVRAERNLWVIHEELSTELRGDVTARKAKGGDLSLAGEIQTQRGWVNLQGRRFKFVEGTIAFTGGHEIDPALDVLARYRVPAYSIFARLGGTATSPTLELSSEPQLEEADILAVLLFGRPVNDLRENEQLTLGNRARSLVSAYGMTAAGKTVARELGLEEAGLQIEELSEDRATVGAYLGQRTFVSVAQEFRAERDQQLSIEYEFWPGWSIVTSTHSSGTNSVDLFWKIRY